MTSRSASAHLRAAATAVALALTLAACGGSGDSDAPTATATPDRPAGETAATPRSFPDVPRLVQELAPSVVAIGVSTQSGDGEGSGVVWDGEGHIVTSNHVIAGA